MSPELEAQKEHLFANVLMHQGRFDEAIRCSRTGADRADWIRLRALQSRGGAGAHKRLADADPFLTAVGTMLAPPRSSRRCATAPISRSALPYLQAEGRRGARAPLMRVRLNGPYSNKALLGHRLGRRAAR